LKATSIGTPNVFVNDLNAMLLLNSSEV